MPFIAPELIIQAKQMDLLTYLRNYEPYELVKFSGNTYCTRTHDSLKIWKEMSFVSLSGVYSPAKKIEDSKVPIALEKYLGSNPSVRKIRIHFDNDMAGRKAAQTLKTILPDKYEIVDEPPKAGKDFNDFLCMRMGIYNKKTHERNEER